MQVLKWYISIALTLMNSTTRVLFVCFTHRAAILLGWQAQIFDMVYSVMQQHLIFESLKCLCGCMHVIRQYHFLGKSIVFALFLCAMIN